MFTGLIQATAKLLNHRDHTITIQVANDFLSDCEIGDSIAVSGVCLTVTSIQHSQISFFVHKETIEKTRFRRLSPGMLLNLEKAMQLQNRLGGHILSGHIDTVGRILQTNPSFLRISFLEKYRVYIVPKGSIAIEGVSLTVADVKPTELTIAVIPETYTRTNLKCLSPGDLVNLEFDLIGKYIVQYMQRFYQDERLKSKFT